MPIIPMLRVLLPLPLALAAATSAHGQEILVFGLNGDLHSVDPHSGQISYIGSTGVHYDLWSCMAQDSQGRLFGAIGSFSQAFAIYEIDPQTGAATFTAQTALFGLSAMAFDANDVLYVANDRTAPQSTRPMDLYTVDLATGAETLIGFTGVYNMLAMDFGPGGLLYGYPVAEGLVIIDTATAVATDVNAAYRGPLGSTVSFCFDDEGAIYYVDGVLWMMDAETGVASIVDWAAPFGYWGEAVFVEGPTPNFSLRLSGTTGGPVKAKVAGATPGGMVALVSGRGHGGPTTIPNGFHCTGTPLRLDADMRLVTLVPADASGKAVAGPQYVSPAAIGTLRLQAVDLTTCKTSNRVIVYS